MENIQEELKEVIAALNWHGKHGQADIVSYFARFCSARGLLTRRDLEMALSTAAVPGTTDD